MNFDPMANQFKCDRFGNVTDFYGNQAGRINAYGDATMYGNTYHNSLNPLNNTLYDNQSNRIGGLSGFDDYKRQESEKYSFPHKNDFFNNSGNDGFDDFNDDYNKPKYFNNPLPKIDILGNKRTGRYEDDYDDYYNDPWASKKPW